MPSTGDLKALLERVRAATGADRGLDYSLFVAFAERDAPNYWSPASGHEYTASIDGALALVGRVLPGWRLSQLRQLVERLGGKFKPTIWDCELEEVNGRGQSDDEAANGSLAIIAALLQACITHAPASPHSGAE